MGQVGDGYDTYVRYKQILDAMEDTFTTDDVCLKTNSSLVSVYRIFKILKRHGVIKLDSYRDTAGHKISIYRRVK